MGLVVAVDEVALVDVVDEVALVVVIDGMVPDVLYDDRYCSRCKIVVTQCHLLQFGMMRGKMANSPTCPNQLAPARHFDLSDTCINTKAFNYQ